MYQQTCAPLHAITTIATGYHTPGSVPTYSPLFILNQDLKPPELSYSLLPFFGDFYNLKIEFQKRSWLQDSIITNYILIN